MKNNVFRSLLLLGFVMLYGFTQAQSVTGTVSDANGPLPGATVLVKGTSNGTTSDFDGKYTLKEVGADATLVVSFVGYVTQEVSTTGKTTVDITLEEDANQLEEVVVVGYTTQTRGDITGSVASVDMAEAVKTPMVNAAEALQGRATGVTITNSGSPGDAPKVVIRGFGSVNSTDPLYIIDGVQTEDADVLNSINPADIEQMNVLKDGAAAIYGARASNGVVIITTKSGSYTMDKATLSVDLYTGAASIINTPELLSAEQHKDMIFQSFTNAGADIVHPQYDPTATGTFTTPSVLQGANLPDVPVNVNPGGTKWLDEILQVGQVQNASVSLQNGTETGRYFMSASFLNREGIQLNTGFKRGTTRLNSDFKISDKVRIGEHVNVSFSRVGNPDANQVSAAMRVTPLTPVYDSAGDFAGGYSNSNGLGNTTNPVATLTRSKDNFSKKLNFFGDVFMEVDVIDGLTAKTVLSGSLQSRNTRRFKGSTPESPEPQGNGLSEAAINSASWTWTNTLNYNKVIEKHNLNVLVGIEATKSNEKGNQVSNSGYLFETPDFYTIRNGSGQANVDFAFDNTSSLYSLFGTANYSYDGKYFVTATLRNDKSSRFKGDNQSGIFPSFSLGWNMSKEDFFPQDALVNRFKLKASYGELGNQSLPSGILTSDVFELSSVLSDYSFSGSSVATGAYLASIGNANIKWETSKSTNVGFDLGMFENALTMSFEYFNITTADMLLLQNVLNPLTGVDGNAPFGNVGDMKNTGVDFSIAYADKTESGLTYNISANISSYKNEVTYLANGTFPGADLRGGAITRTEEGQPISYFYGRIVDGVFATETDVTSAADQGFVTPADGVGRFKYKDVNGDNVINDDDRAFIGSPHPDFTYGINLGADYKGFDISAFLQGSQGNDIYNYEKIFSDFPTFFNNNRSTRVLNSWTPTNTGATLPALRNNVVNNETAPNSFFVEDGSYLRLKNMQIGYTFPEATSSKLGMQSLRFYLQGTNLLTLTGYEGLDPEIRNSTTIDGGGNLSNGALGVDFNTYPQSKILSLGVNIKF